MPMKMYIAVQSNSAETLLNDQHVTLSFADVKETKKLDLGKLAAFFPCQCYVEKIEYLTAGKVTVAIIKPCAVDKNPIEEAYDYCNSVGFDYTLEFKPHITLGYKGDQTADFEHLVGEKVELTSVYLRLKDFS